MAGQTTVRELLIAIIIFTAVISGIFTIIALSAPTQSFGNDAQFNTTFNKFAEVKSNADSISDTVRTEKGKPAGLFGILNDLLELAWGAIKQIWTSIDILTTILQDVSDTFGVPLWVTQALSAIVLIGIIFALMAAWFRWLI